MSILIVWILVAASVAILGRIVGSDGLTAVGGAVIMMLAAVAGVSSW